MRAAALVLVVAGVTGCAPSALGTLGGGGPDTLTTPSPTREAPGPEDSPTPAPSPPSEPSACLTGGGGMSSRVSYTQPVEADVPTGQRAAPWKDRPVVQLCFDVSTDRRFVTGTETVLFTPDRRTCEVVFRAWPNKPETARAGNRLVVTAAAVRGRMVTPKVESAGAPPGVPGTLVRLPVAGCLSAGQQVTINLMFTLTLGTDTPERVGYSTEDRTAWLGTAFPLLAWERGRGWATEPAVDLFGETVTSEEFKLELLEVIAPRGVDVLGTGRELGTTRGPNGKVVHRFTADAVRDVTVTVGDLTVVEREVDGVRLRVGVPEAGSLVSADVWAEETAAAIRELSDYLGPFPYSDLWVTIAPDVPTGIEFTGGIQFGDVDPAEYPELVPHEVAHMWFYGLVGNNQARDPWLDESFAEYAEKLVNGDGRADTTVVVPPRVRNRVGETMTWYGRLGVPDLYGVGVYQQGGAMLHRARRAVGPATFDRLLRAYIDANAHQIVTDDDVVEAFASQPEVVEILEEHGAISD